MQHQETAPEEPSPLPTHAEIIWAKRVFGREKKLWEKTKTRFDTGETPSLEIPRITENLRRAMAILLNANEISERDMLAMGEIIDEDKKANGSPHHNIIHPGDEFE